MARQSLFYASGLCCGNLTKPFAFGRQQCEMATDNPEKIENVIEQQVRKKPSGKSGVILFSLGTVFWPGTAIIVN